MKVNNILKIVVFVSIVSCVIGVLLSQESNALRFDSPNSGRLPTSSSQLPEISNKTWSPYPPPNATVIPTPRPFSLRLNVASIGGLGINGSTVTSVARGGSQTVQVGVFDMQAANVSLSVRTDNHYGSNSLPSGLNAVFDQDSLTLQPNSTVVSNFTMFVGNETTPGTYNLFIVGTQLDNGWFFQDAIPLELEVS